MLNPETKLGPYEILAAIGAGGMGEVYRARDSKLGRNVAIKVLPEAFARDADRMARFQREAELLASLNHPNIATIHGLEDSGPTHALVMELVEGPTLADRIAQGPIPVEEALSVAKQIADALEYAHEHGIIHRDLKPANVKVAADDTVKILDFGLAKALETEPSAAELANSPTLSHLATQAGVLLGTAAYMSPEQAKAKPVDCRADIWAFGCVLYEMLTGKMAFGGDTVTDTLAAVIRAEPDWSQLPSATPMRVRVLLQRCLQKDVRQRLRDIGDARIALDDVLPGAPEAASPLAATMPAWRRAIPWAAGVLAVVVASLATWNLKPSPSPARAAHLQLALPLRDRLDVSELNLALSSDGNEVAFVGIPEGVPQLYVRALDAQEAKALPGTEGASNPFFSPDGQWIGFFAQGKMKKIPVGGGAPLAICDSGVGAGASWGPDDTIVFSPSVGRGLSRVPAAGGQPKILTTADTTKGEYSLRYPQILPGGKAVLFTALGGLGWDESRVEVLRLDTGKRRVLIRGGSTGRYLPSGHLVYYRAGALLAVPFDLGSLEVKGNAPVTVADGIRLTTDIVAAAYAVSDAGTLVYIPAAASQFERHLVWVDRQGNLDSLPVPARAYGPDALGQMVLALSPDGQQAVVTILSGTTQLWILDLRRGSLTPLTSDQWSSSGQVVWTPDGERVVYRSNKAGIWNLYWRPANAPGSEERLTTSDDAQLPFSVSPDGKLLAFADDNPTTGYDIWILPLEGERKPQPFLRTPSNEVVPQFSPDGHWLAYVSDESGGWQVYVQPYPGPGRSWQISTDGGYHPQWNPKGRELFYRNGNRTMVVDVTTSPTFRVGKPRVLYEGPEGEVSRDGQRFLSLQAVGPEQPERQINVVLSWTEELKRLVPLGNSHGSSAIDD